MRVRALVMVCFVVAVLSGLALFSPYYQFRGGWLDGIFLVAVAVLLVVALKGFSGMAERSVAESVDEDLDADDSTWRDR
jgi:cytochrome b subunit of formate dehydrogenase